MKTILAVLLGCWCSHALAQSGRYRLRHTFNKRGLQDFSVGDRETCVV